MSSDLEFVPSLHESAGMCLQVGNQTILTLTELGEAFPSLIADAQEDPALTVRLTEGICALTGRGPVVSDPEQTWAEILGWAEPPLSRLSWWSTRLGLDAPARTALRAPHWEEGQLVFQTWDRSWGHLTMHVFAQRVVLDPATWTFASESLPTGLVGLDDLPGRLASVFGETAEGALGFQLPGGARLLVGVGPGLPQRFGWIDSAGDRPQSYDDWSALVVAHPEVGEPEALAKLAGALASYFDHHGRQEFHLLDPIRDGDAYRAEYREKDWGTFRLKYWVDQVRETRCDCPDLDTVAGPTLEEGRLVAFFKGEKNQPFRLDVDLAGLTLEPPALVALATETVVFDSGKSGGGGLDSGPRPLSERIRPTRPSDS